MHIANRQIWQFNLTAKLRLITTDRIDSWVVLKDFWKPLGNYRRGNSAFDIISPLKKFVPSPLFITYMTLTFLIFCVFSSSTFLSVLGLSH